MALFGVVPDYGVDSEAAHVVSDYDPRDKCMTEGPAWLINVFDGNRIFGKGQALTHGQTSIGPMLVMVKSRMARCSAWNLIWTQGPSSFGWMAIFTGLASALATLGFSSVRSVGVFGGQLVWPSLGCPSVSCPRHNWTGFERRPVSLSFSFEFVSGLSHVVSTGSGSQCRNQSVSSEPYLRVY